MSKTFYKILAFATAITMAIGSYANTQAAESLAPTLVTGKLVNIAYFYKPPQNANAATLAQNISTFILTRADETFRDELKANGVTAPIMQYVRFEAIQNPGSCTVQPFRNQVAYKIGDFCSISKNHPDWFLLDNNGNRIVVDGNYYYMDPGNQEWREFWLNRTIESQEQLGWYGVFLDNVEAGLSKVIRSGGIPAKYPDDASYRVAVLDFLKYLYPTYFKPQNRPLFANIISLGDPAVWNNYLQYLDGAMDEAWAVDWRNGYISVSDWNEQLARAEQTQNLGKFALLVSQGSETDTNRQKFAFASYLLISAGKASFRYTNYDNYEKVWLYPNYQIDLGQPLGPRYRQGNLWRRDFSKGSVIVDPVNHSASILKKVTYNDKHPSFVYSAGWRELTVKAAAGGSFKYTGRLGATAKFTFTGQSFSILYTAGPKFGNVTVYVDGVKVGTINQRALTNLYRQRWDYAGQLKPGQHVLTLKFTGPEAKFASLDGVIVYKPVP